MKQTRKKNPEPKRIADSIPMEQRKKMADKFWKDAEKLRRLALDTLLYVDWLKRTYK